MTRIVFVRHAQSAPDPALPERDWPLSEKGRAQAADLVPVLTELGVTALASSPFVRAIDTLRPFADTAGLDIHVDEDLRERHLGGWIADVADVEEAVRRMHADLAFKMEGGESGHECIARFDAALTRVIEGRPGECVAVASHGGVLSHLIARHRDDLPREFWRSIRNPHMFFFDWADAPRWVGERTLHGEPGVVAW
ncbi:MAG: histidine phosphatase family protein [Caulobacterales bacterium]